MSTDRGTRRAWVEIDAGALRRNYRRVVEAVGPAAPVIPMVKADGYGVGALDVVRVLADEGPAGWGVATVAEGTALRDGGVQDPVYVFSPVIVDDLPEAVESGLTVTLSDLGGLEGLRRAARAQGATARFQVEIDTGMGRAGFLPAEVGAWGPRVAEAHGRDGLVWVGTFTHFHSADEQGGPDVHEQAARFEATAARLSMPDTCQVHLANSAAAFRLGAESGGARPGVFLYGGGIGPDQPDPEPVVAVRARVVRTRTADLGDTAGYGATYRASADETWATLAIGYADGLPRALGGRGAALVAGTRVPLVGRMSMDMTVANISGLAGVEAGDVATLIGGDGAAAIRLDEVAGLAGTLSYEILTGLGPRLPRVWTNDGGA